MHKVELIAPAGNKKSLIGAINAGADAIYLSDRAFGVRAYGHHFEKKDIIEAIHYAHLRGVLVYIDIQTLIFNDELDTLLDHADAYVEASVDGFIVSDYGIMDLFVKRYPTTNIHTSHLINTHHVSQAKFLKTMGVKRITLARETSIATIKKIKKEIDIEVEVFVQGALCISYSGQCQASMVKGDGSAALGTCSGPCRGLFRLLEDNKTISSPLHLLSAKDLMLIEHLDQLMQAGVDAFKIEGSFQRPEYVVQAVLSYRNAIQKHMLNIPVHLEDDIIDLKKIHNRQYTKGYMFQAKPEDIVNVSSGDHLGIPIGKIINQTPQQISIRLTDTLNLADGLSYLTEDGDIQREMVTSMTINDIHVASAYAGNIVKIDVSSKRSATPDVYKSKDYQLEQNLSLYFKENFKKVPLQGHIKVSMDDYIVYTITDGKHSFTIYSEDLLDEAPGKPTTNAQIEAKLSAFGMTPYYFERLEIENDKSSFVPAKWLNDLSQQAIDRMTEARLEQPEIIINRHRYLDIREVEEQPKGLVSKVRTLDQLNACYDQGISLIYYQLPLNVDFHKYQNATLIPVLPRVFDEVIDHPETYMTETLTENDLSNLVKYAGAFLQVTNIHTANLLQGLGFESVTLSQEMSYERVMAFYDQFRSFYKRHINLEMCVYGKSELMLSKHDVVAAYQKSTPHHQRYQRKDYALKDALNHVYPLIDDGYRHLIILNHEPLCLIKYLEDLKKAEIKTYQLHFSNETYHQVLYIIRLFKKALRDQGVPNTFKLRHTIGSFNDEAR